MLIVWGIIRSEYKVIPPSLAKYYLHVYFYHEIVG